MAVFTDFIAHSIVIDKTEPQSGTARSAYNELLGAKARMDPTQPAAFDAMDAVKVVAKHVATASGGNFTITITEPDGTEHTTANISYNAEEGTIETAIDVVCTGNITDWTNADISVALTGNLTANAATVTFDGTSVTEQNYDLTTTDVDITGGGTVGAVTTTTYGQGIRYAWAVMHAFGMIPTSVLPAQGELLAVDSLTSTTRWPNAALRKALAWQAAIDDNSTALQTQLESLFHVA